MIVTAGALMNLILGFLLLVIVVSQQQAIGTTTVARFEDGATSSQMLQVDDKILKINGSSINIDYDIIYTMMRDSDGAVDMVVLREDVYKRQVEYDIEVNAVTGAVESFEMEED